MTSAAPPKFPTRDIPIALIDPPELAIRESMIDEGLASLADSLRTLGQLEPIGVKERGERFEVIFGHRRRVAAERAGFVELECKVYPADLADAEARKVAENADQEPVNPVGEATYYAELFEKHCGCDVEAVARFVRKPLSRILDRLDLLRGDEAVLDALREPSSRRSESPLREIFAGVDPTKIGQITQAVARELNKVKNDNYRRLFLADAIRDGMNSTAVRQRRQELDRTLRLQEISTELASRPVDPSTAAPIVTIDACVICLTAGDEHEMEYVRVHRSCRAVHARHLVAGAGGQGNRA